MIKFISIYENKECFFVNREVVSADDLPVDYGPVHRVGKENFDLDTFSEALEKSFESSGEFIQTLYVGRSSDDFKQYTSNRLKSYGAKSLKKFEQDNLLFEVQKEGDRITFYPSVYKRRAYYPDEENQRTINVQGKSSLEIGEDIYNLIQEYHRDKAER